VAMVRSEREPLLGLIEVDESFVGGVKRGGKRGRGTRRSIVVIAIEIKEPKGFGRIRMRYVPDASGDKMKTRNPLNGINLPIRLLSQSPDYQTSSINKRTSVKGH